MWLAQEFSIGLTRGPGRVVVTVRGDLDAGTAPRLRDAVADLVDDDGHRDLVIDMAGLTIIDSSGIRVLIQALKLVRSAGRDLTLTGTRPGAYKVLDVCGFTSVFDLPRPVPPSVRANGQPRRRASGRWH